MYNNSVRNSFLLLLTAIIWGTSFVAQAAGMVYIGPFTFSVVRYILGGTVLIPVSILYRKYNKKNSLKAGSGLNYSQKEKNRLEKKQKDINQKDINQIGYNDNFGISIKHGIICGIILCAASNFQQIAMLRASTGKAGFITALYIIIVPIIGLLLKKKTSPVIYISVILAVIGLYFLCIGRGNSYTFEPSDLQLLVCSLIFSFHIIYIDHANEKGVDGVVMSCTQFFTAAVISAFFVYPMDGIYFNMMPSFELIKNAFPALCYSGFMACGVAYTLQIIGQKDVNPTVASLIMSLESVVSAISGFLILGQKLSLDEITGCAIMFFAIILAELPFPAGTARKLTEN